MILIMTKYLWLWFLYNIRIFYLLYIVFPLALYVQNQESSYVLLMLKPTSKNGNTPIGVLLNVSALWLFMNVSHEPVGEGVLWESSTAKSDSKDCIMFNKQIEQCCDTQKYVFCGILFCCFFPAESHFGSLLVYYSIILFYFV